MSSIRNSADVIVAGLGAMGSAVCWQLAKRGTRVIGFDRHRPPHPYGSTHGETRITRLAIGEGAEYVPFVLRSNELWDELERQTGRRIRTRTGGLVIGPSADSFVEQTRAAARQYEIPHTDLSRDELRQRFPMFEIPAGFEGYYEPDSGILRPEAAVETELELARRHGARLHFNERVQAWHPAGDGVNVRTDRATYRTEQLVLCVGPWIHEQLPQARELFAIYRQLLFWFPLREHYERFAQMPIFIFDFGGERRGFTHLDGFYGFPAIDGPHGGLKLGTEQFERVAEPDDTQHPASRIEIDEMYERCVRPHLRWIDAEPLRTVSCLYTSTRGNRFAIDRHPEHEAVLIVSPCSGHGFKHSPAIGESVAQLLTEGRSQIGLGAFALSGIQASG